jgi:8-oxo-dGTP pyrophosphatase MutT (NUDIX family)
MRRPEEVFVVVHRAADRGREFLVLERSPERHGYWHLVSGALEPGEETVDAARRELLEEVGLETPVEPLGTAYIYSLADEPPDVRDRFAPEVTEIAVTAFVVEAPRGWEPDLDDEHVGYRWCGLDDAVSLLRYPEPRDAVSRAAERLGVGV